MYITCKLSVQFCTFPHSVYKGTKTTDFFVTAVSQCIQAAAVVGRIKLEGFEVITSIHLHADDNDDDDDDDDDDMYCTC